MSKHIRIPVIHKRKPLMPMKVRRAIQYVEEGKAKWRFDNKLGMRYIILLQEPSGFDLQPIHLGFDPGSHFDGISVVSDKCHHLNIELIHNKEIKKRMKTRSTYRKIRRSRLRHRPIRFSSRNKKKMSPTIRSMFDFRKWAVERIVRYFPISKAIVEKVVYGGKNQFSFAQVHQGQNQFINWLKEKFPVSTIAGFITKKKRIKLFNGEDKKTGNKAEESFFAHCLDSTAIASLGLQFKIKYLNQKTRLIKKIWYNRRELHQTRKMFKNKKYHIKYEKGGEAVYFIPIGKKNVSRVKVNKEHSNHPKQWVYKKKKRSGKYHMFKSSYGGTRKHGIDKTMRLKHMNTREVIKPKGTHTFKSISILPTEIICFERQQLRFC